MCKHMNSCIYWPNELRSLRSKRLRRFYIQIEVPIYCIVFFYSDTFIYFFSYDDTGAESLEIEDPITYLLIIKIIISAERYPLLTCADVPIANGVKSPTKWSDHLVHLCISLLVNPSNNGQKQQKSVNKITIDICLIVILIVIRARVDNTQVFWSNLSKETEKTHYMTNMTDRLHFNVECEIRWFKINLSIDTMTAKPSY